MDSGKGPQGCIFGGAIFQITPPNMHGKYLSNLLELEEYVIDLHSKAPDAGSNYQCFSSAYLEGTTEGQLQWERF
ncbi:hypothetical protein COV81_01425 [Candidatus Peregrinibacteria bacterium CG11_big_fil_rev_8_21_14_0_20_41_10]|nr:MAG: hypothetical protein COV81_01425 [Candidatus Peregrinibacteria bacterium CG11_big_fil_rev_8_21_14_0_20_41_10]PIZ75208.1 MAG: hypothetical protein COY06_03135 [Candidatus Peregrinibacteria bacterium CG_4_10_14_0_2_um_filter_41_8]PJC38066.1 MAG: hypothetical protein CO045_02205 [Candidatus Peregrinibacteria bacterium CG_4_9_14_0_2_um_filter_41_14]